MATKMSGTKKAPVGPVTGLKRAKLRAAENGYDIRDATKWIEFGLTDTDIKKGTPLDQENCAFAQCGIREYEASWIWIGRTFTFIEVPEDETIWRFATPAEVKLETDVGDRKGEMLPGSYVFRPVHKSNRLGHGRRSQDTGTGKKHKRSSKETSGRTRRMTVRAG